MEDIEMVPCNECGRRTRHVERARYETSSIEQLTTVVQAYSTLECGGCGTFAFRHRLWFSDFQVHGDDPVYVDKYYPPRLDRPEPEWFAQLSDILQQVLGETYDSYYNDQRYLTAVGIRTSLDIALVEIIGDKGSFAMKLQEVTAQGFISKDESELLVTALEAGNAAAHRGFQPAREDLEVMVDILESLLYGLFIKSARNEELRSSARDVRGRIPQRRPPRGPSHGESSEG